MLGWWIPEQVEIGVEFREGQCSVLGQDPCLRTV